MIHILLWLGGSVGQDYRLEMLIFNSDIEEWEILDYMLRGRFHPGVIAAPLHDYIDYCIDWSDYCQVLFYLIIKKIEFYKQWLESRSLDVRHCDPVKCDI